MSWQARPVASLQLYGARLSFQLIALGAAVGAAGYPESRWPYPNALAKYESSKDDTE